jgi:hypothetical protein
LKSAYQNNRFGLTLVEILVVCIVLGVFFTGLYALYRSNVNTFSATVWKQEKARQLELFWAQLRKALEEASNRIDLSGEVGLINPSLSNHVEAPLMYKALPNDVDYGELLSWNSTTVNLDFSPPYAHSTSSLSYDLYKTGTRLELIERTNKQISRILTALTDVSSVEFKVGSIVIENGEEEISYTGGLGAVGSYLEVFITLSPPVSAFRGDSAKISQSQKFRLNVLCSEI